jgi:hypothetical protein
MNRFDRLFPLGVVNIVFGVLMVIPGVLGIVLGGAVAETASSMHWGAEEASVFSASVLGVAIVWLLMGLFLLATGILQVLKKKSGAICGIVFGVLVLIGLIVNLLVMLDMNLPDTYASVTVILPLFIALLPLANIIVSVSALTAASLDPVGGAVSTSAIPSATSPRPAPTFSNPTATQADYSYAQSPHRDSGNTAVYSENGPSVLIQIRVRGENMDPYTVQLIDHVKNKIKSRIGRNTDCDVSIPQDFTVSGEHCEIFMNSTGGVMIQDMNSTHGTYVLRGKNKVSATSPVQVFDGDRIQLGQYTVLTLTFRNMK